MEILCILSELLVVHCLTVQISSFQDFLKNSDVTPGSLIIILPVPSILLVSNPTLDVYNRVIKKLYECQETLLEMIDD